MDKTHINKLNAAKIALACAKWEPRREEILRFMQQGVSMAVAARSFGERPGTLREVMRRMNITSPGARGNYDGRSQTGAYKAWRAMKSRCTNPNQKHAHRYVNRGITYCARWEYFENFRKDMGERPRNMTLERIDNEKGYSPENCRWATRKEQARNTSTNRMIEYMGISRPMAQWAEEAGLPLDTFKRRIYLGWSMDRALENPVSGNEREMVSA